MITIDSREKKIQHITKNFDALKVPYTVHKLAYADYCNDEEPGVLIDRKQNLDEIAQNLCSNDDRRFWNEIRGAHKAGTKIIILCEHGKDVKSVRDVVRWKSPHSKVNGNWLIAQMIKLQMAYGVEWRFCDKSETAREILRALKYKGVTNER